MNTLLIFIWIYAAMIANSFWEAYAEGRNAWDKGKHGWKLKIGKYTVMTGYHFFLFVIMWPLLLTLPLIIHGWFANYYPRVKIGNIKIPTFYFIGLFIAFLSWLFIWK